MRYKVNLMSMPFLLACLAGLGFQLSYIVDHYMGYKTVTQVIAKTANLSSPVDFTICYSYPFVFNYDQFYKDSGSKAAIFSSLDDYFDRFTVKQIFQYTPSVEQLFHTFSVRYPGDNYITEKRDKLWEGIFHSSKFLTQGFICFTITVTIANSSRLNYDYDQVARALLFNSAIYLMKLNVTSASMKIVVHERHSRPTNNIKYSPTFTVDETAGQTFDISFKELLIESKEPPYETMCRKYRPQHRGRSDCIMKCKRNATLTQLDKVPHDIFEYDSDLEKMNLAGNDFRNETIIDMLTDIQEHCRSKCSQPNCVEHTTTTRMAILPIRDIHTVFISVPKELSITIRYREAIETLDFVVYVMSSAGTWLGLSVLHLDPTKWLRKLWLSMAENTKKRVAPTTNMYVTCVQYYTSK
ncbi:hypothetical protein HDE_14070 [Halotydeus destructor]|nr:hypothetical protein HDE_14070 [Halotydeus destructor]